MCVCLCVYMHVHVCRYMHDDRVCFVCVLVFPNHIRVSSPGFNGDHHPMQPRIIIQSDVDGNSESEAQGTWALGPNDCLIGLKIGQVIYRYLRQVESCWINWFPYQHPSRGSKVLPSIVICLSFGSEGVPLAMQILNMCNSRFEVRDWNQEVHHCGGHWM